MRAPARGLFYRHVLREIGMQTLLVAAVLLAVLLVYQFSFVLGRAADGQIPGESVPMLLGLSLRSNLGVILPFAVLLGVVLGLGRMYYDSEIAAAHAAGVGTAVLYAAAATVVLPAALLAAWVAFFDGPAAAREVVALRMEALRTAVTRGLVPGSFRDLGGGITLHFRAQDAEGQLLDVFVQRELPAGADAAPRMQMLLARRARYAIVDAGAAVTVLLFDGQSHEGVPGSLDWRITRFGEQLLTLPVPAARLPGRRRVDVLGNAELLDAGEPPLVAELHWRIGWVVPVLLLGFLAVPLSRLAPRQGRHARVPLAVLLFAVYAGLLTSGRTLLERGETPLLLGLWWVHAAAFVLAALLLGWPRALARAAAGRARKARP
jgi:lipopolysaccharide export system permease protein